MGWLKCSLSPPNLFEDSTSNCYRSRSDLTARSDLASRSDFAARSDLTSRSDLSATTASCYTPAQPRPKPGGITAASEALSFCFLQAATSSESTVPCRMVVTAVEGTVCCLEAVTAIESTVCYLQFVTAVGQLLLAAFPPAPSEE